jgi:hypothetical protein
MDKNFIKIDDLVRQRLGGVEERERSGSWLNMRELLDKEMPQRKRIGIFYWRRIFNAVAIMSLVATVCVGSYEFSSAFRGNSTSDVTAIAEVSGVNRESGSSFNVPANENTSVDSEKEAIKLAGRYYTGKEQKKRYIAPTNRADKVSETATAPSVARKESVAKQPSDKNGITSKTTDSRITGTTTNTYLTVNNHKSSVTVSKGLINESDTKNAATATMNSASGSIKNDGNESGANKDANAVATVSPAAGKDAAAQQNVGSSNTNGAKAANRSAKAKSSFGNNHPAGVALKDNRPSSAKANIDNSAANDNVIENSAMAAATKRANSDKGKPGHKSASNSKQSLNGATDMGEMALNSTSKSNSADKTVAEKMAIATQTPMSVKGDNPTATSATSIPAMQAGVTASESKNGATSAALTTPATAVASNTAVAANKPAGRSLGTGGVATKNPAAEKTSQNKKVIMKLLVHQRKIKISDNEYSDQLDTISMEKVHMDLGIKTPAANTASDDNLKSKKGSTDLASTTNAAKTNAAGTATNENSNNTIGAIATAANTTTANNAPAVKEKAALSTSGAVAAKSAKAGGNKKAANNSAAANDEVSGAVSEEGAVAEDNAVAAQPLIGAATTAATLPAGSAEVKNKPEAAKKSSGVSLIQKLSLAFNDVKQNAGAAKFTAGLTAGINSNYFGTSQFQRIPVWCNR